MKIIRIILYCLGILCILFNLIGLIRFGYARFPVPPGPVENKIGWWIGLHAFIIIGITLLITAWVLGIRSKKLQVQDKEINSIGEDITVN